MTALIVGIDQSATHTAVVVIDAFSRELHGDMLIVPQTVGTLRLKEINAKIRQFLGQQNTYRIGVHEAYSFGSVHQAFLLGEVGGIVKMALHDHCARVEEAAPTALKKYMADHGGASKEDMKYAVKQRWGVHYTSDDLADAFALAQLGYDLLHPEKITTRKQLEVATGILTKEMRMKTKKRKTQHKPGKEMI